MILKKENVAALLQALSETQPVYVPGVAGEATRFVPYADGVEARFDLVNVKMPPKDAFFPATEKMYRWTRRDGDLSIETDFQAAGPFTLFGVRPCDMASIDRLDAVFLTCGYVDEFYETRRNAATVVAVSCANPSATCFCDSMGIDPNEAPSADVLLKDGGSAFEVVAQSEKGAAAVQAWKPYLEEGQLQVPQAHCTLKVDMSAVPEKLHAMFDDPIWQDVADQCITCGTCTFVCPTCYCFDISQDVRADEGNRFRCWDSCMFSDYTRMAGGHNPRAAKASRVRQRFMHKLCYFNDRYGMDLCVGCGRCMRDCPAAVDITLIIDRIAAADPAVDAQAREAMAHA